MEDYAESIIRKEATVANGKVLSDEELQIGILSASIEQDMDESKVKVIIALTIQYIKIVAAEITAERQRGNDSFKGWTDEEKLKWHLNETTQRVAQQLNCPHTLVMEIVTTFVESIEEARDKQKKGNI